MAKKKLDCLGLKCPMPIIEINRAIKALETGEILEIEADDLAFKPDINAWLKKVGHDLISFEENPHFKVQIRKS